MITVIVPIYNAATTLRRCVDSILRQTYRDFELLLINDGSTDASPQICDEYARQDSRVRVFHKENGGVSSARNVGLDNARGEWITFCDADDWVFPCWLQNYDIWSFRVYDYIVQGFETDKPLFFYTDNKEIDCRRFALSYDGSVQDGFEQIAGRLLGFVWCKAYRRKIIQEHFVRFDGKFNYQEDLEFNIRYLCLCRKMKCLPYIGYHYNVPDWGRKYSRKKNLLELNKSKFVCSSFIMSGRKSNTVKYYFSNYTASLLCAFKRKDIDRVERLREYRQLSGGYLLKSRLFFVTRWTIYLDSSLLLARVVLFLHCRIKRIQESC